MAHSTPTGDVNNMGDAWRATTCAGAFVIALVVDPRVNAFYPIWLDGRNKAFTRIAEVKLNFLERGLPFADHERQALDSYFEREREVTRHFVVTLLKLPEAWADWVAVSLVDAFAIRRHNEHYPDDPQQFGIHVFMPKGSPKGRKPRADGADIERNAQWFYRAKVKVPPDSIHALGAEYVAAHPPSFVDDPDDGRKTVRDGIAQANALLDVVAERAVRLTNADFDALGVPRNPQKP